MATARKKKRDGGRLARVRAATRKALGNLRGAGWKRLGLGVVLAAAAALLMADYQLTRSVRLTLGEIAERDVEAWADFRVPDYHLTMEAQRKAESSTRPVFVYDELVSDELLRRIDHAFADLSEALTAAAAEPQAKGGNAGGGGASATASPGDPQAVEQALDRFESDLGITLMETDRATLSTLARERVLSDMVMTLVERTMSRMIIGDVESLPDNTGIGISLVRVRGAQRTEEVLYDFGDLITLQQARAELSRLGAEQFDRQAAYIVACAVNVAHAVIRPNLTLDASETQVRRDQARAAVGVIYTEFKENQVIVRQGELVTQEHLDALQELEKYRGTYKLWANGASLFLLALLLIVATYQFGARFVSKFATSVRDVAAMVALAILGIGLCRVGEMMASALHDAFPVIPEESYYFAVPVAGMAVMIRILMNSETAVVFSAAVALLCAYVLGGDLLLAVYFFVGSVAAAGALAHAKQRGKVFRAGLVASLVNVAAVIIFTLVRLSVFGAGSEEAAATPLWDIVFALLGGIAVGILALGLVPVFEAAGFLTDIKLLELASLDHPLMREMVIKAPGTYHHSVLVGSLAEAAAEAISANALLARVGSYFHDIGKTVKNQYFVENQPDASNIHDRLSPSMSALIIINHVKEGIELGKQHRLPREILDIIPQHHGTALIRYFYAKAQELADEDKGSVTEDDYRYPGPKPQTREAGIVMLADGVEAATRSLKEPTRHNISARVQKVINGVVIDGQLDQCPLTLKDLSIVAETFTSVLVGIHHHRVEYPEERGNGRNGGGEREVSVKKKAKGSSKSLTLELPPMTSNPDLPHPLDKEARAAAEEAMRTSEPGTSQAARKVDDITTSGERAVDDPLGAGDDEPGRSGGSGG